MDQYISLINLESANQELYIKLANATKYKNAYDDLVSSLEKLPTNTQIDSTSMDKILTENRVKFNIGL
jgi:hypothetical protein